MLLSVIIPVFNAEKVLDDCLKSVTKALPKDGEIILIDDYSTDLSKECYIHWQQKDERIKVLFNDKKGVSSARNYGLSYATGDYIAFVDADDCVKQDLFNKMISVCDITTDLVTCQVIKRKKNKKGYSKKNKIFYMKKDYILSAPKEAMEDMFYYHYASAVWGKLFRRKNILNEDGTLKIHFQEELTILEDLCFLADYLKNCDGKIKRLAEQGYFYTIQYQNKVSKPQISMLQNGYEYVMWACQEVDIHTAKLVKLHYMEHIARILVKQDIHEINSKENKRLQKILHDNQAFIHNAKELSFMKKCILQAIDRRLYMMHMILQIVYKSLWNIGYTLD